MKLLQKGNFSNTKKHCMKELDILANYVAIKQNLKVNLPNTVEQYMKESNTHANNVIIKQLQREI